MPETSSVVWVKEAADGCWLRAIVEATFQDEITTRPFGRAQRITVNFRDSTLFSSKRPKDYRLPYIGKQKFDTTKLVDYTDYQSEGLLRQLNADLTQIDYPREEIENIIDVMKAARRPRLKLVMKEVKPHPFPESPKWKGVCPRHNTDSGCGGCALDHRCPFCYSRVHIAIDCPNLFYRADEPLPALADIRS